VFLLRGLGRIVSHNKNIVEILQKIILKFINRLNKRDAEYVNDQSTDYETLLPIAKNFIIDCKKQYGNKLFASSIETKRKFDKIFSTLQNLPPKLKRYEI
jgi:hypothetical protein